MEGGCEIRQEALFPTSPQRQFPARRRRSGAAGPPRPSRSPGLFLGPPARGRHPSWAIAPRRPRRDPARARRGQRPRRSRGLGARGVANGWGGRSAVRQGEGSCSASLGEGRRARGAQCGEAPDPCGGRAGSRVPWGRGAGPARAAPRPSLTVPAAASRATARPPAAQRTKGKPRPAGAPTNPRRPRPARPAPRPGSRDLPGRPSAPPPALPWRPPRAGAAASLRGHAAPWPRASGGPAEASGVPLSSPIATGRRAPSVAGHLASALAGLSSVCTSLPASVSWLLIAAPAVGKGLAVVMFDSDGLLVNLQ